MSFLGQNVAEISQEVVEAKKMLLEHIFCPFNSLRINNDITCGLEASKRDTQLYLSFEMMTKQNLFKFDCFKAVMA